MDGDGKEGEYMKIAIQLLIVAYSRHIW